ncbi:hypothetical protein ON010_g15764 [Phytophthora cinnamomi]|nr:hypothetical protein ON010_g15764 [Phytophthora cinnamomi]
MLVPPRPWTDVVNGGYLKLRTKIMRQRDSAWQMDCVQRGEMGGILKALNLMAEVPWVINKEVLNVVLQIWEDGGNFGDLPTRTDVPLPDPDSPEFADDPALYYKNVRKVAEEFKDEPELFYPYNMDFRGRVYPIPPNLNHLGSDLSRSLLIFRDRKPLGERGLRWMKIHLANVFGVDKCSFDERVEFADANLDKVVASATDPLGEGDGSWWKGADYPFLALGVCFELKRAIESPDPTKYMSNIPIHQDGSCNGLQHYAALGRDRSGGSQVNLVPAPRPSDVYMGVATEVMAKVEHDAALDVPAVEEVRAMIAGVPDDDSFESKNRRLKLRALLEQAQRKKCAQFLNGIITLRREGGLERPADVVDHASGSAGGAAVPQQGHQAGAHQGATRAHGGQRGSAGEHWSPKVRVPAQLRPLAGLDTHDAHRAPLPRRREDLVRCRARQLLDARLLRGHYEPPTARGVRALVRAAPAGGPAHGAAAALPRHGLRRRAATGRPRPPQRARQSLLLQLRRTCSSLSQGLAK